MKDVLVYSALRIALFVATALVVFWVYSLFTDRVVLLYVILITALLSVPLSWILLRGPRDRVARRVQARAQDAAERMERLRAREDVD